MSIYGTHISTGSVRAEHAEPWQPTYPLTIAGWFWADAFGNNNDEIVFALRPSHSASWWQGIAIAHNVSGTNGCYYWVWGGTGGRVRLNDTSAVTLNQWNHVLGRSFDTTTHELWINGINVDSDATAPDAFGTQDVVSMGAQPNNPSRATSRFAFDTPAVWSAYLSQGEIERLAWERQHPVSVRPGALEHLILTDQYPATDIIRGGPMHAFDSSAANDQMVGVTHGPQLWIPGAGGLPFKAPVAPAAQDFPFRRYYMGVG